MSLINILLPPNTTLAQDKLDLYQKICLFKGEFLSYFETIETRIGVIILASKQVEGILQYSTLEQPHLSKSTTTRKITKAIFHTTELGYLGLATKLEYFRKVLWLRNFFAHSNFYVKDAGELTLVKRSQDSISTELVFRGELLSFKNSEQDKQEGYWNNKTLQDIESELNSENAKLVELTQSYLGSLGITEIVYYC